MKEHEDTPGPLEVVAGEHHLEFNHPIKRVSGSLKLEAWRQPHGFAFGLPMPEHSVIRDSQGRRVGYNFPSLEHHNYLKGRLHSNLPVLLADVTIEHVGPGYDLNNSASAFVNSTVAFVGEGADQDIPQFNRMRLQVSGFAQVFGTIPIQRINAPGLLPLGFSDQVELEWEVDSVCVKAYWETYKSNDPYHVEIKNSPWLEIVRAEAADWDYWLKQWVRPIADLVSLATGDARQPTIIEVSYTCTSAGREIKKKAQVFGSGLTQARFYVEWVRHRPPLFKFSKLPYEIHDLVRRWLELRKRIPGFIDAYIPIVRGVQQTPAADFLLLVIAAEAIHIARYGEGPTTSEDHKQRRKCILRKIKESVSREDYDFLQRHLGRRNSFNLEQRIAKLIEDCPAEIRSSLESNDLSRRVSPVRNDLVHGRRVSEELGPLIRNLRIILSVQLLVELGLPLDEVVKHINWR